MNAERRSTDRMAELIEEMRTILARGSATVQDAPVLDPRELWGEESPRTILTRVVRDLNIERAVEPNVLIGQGLTTAVRIVERELAKTPPREVGS